MLTSLETDVCVVKTVTPLVVLVVSVIVVADTTMFVAGNVLIREVKVRVTSTTLL